MIFLFLFLFYIFKKEQEWANLHGPIYNIMFMYRMIRSMEIDLKESIKWEGINYSRVLGETSLEGWQHFHRYYAYIKFSIGNIAWFAISPAFTIYLHVLFKIIYAFFPLHESTCIDNYSHLLLSILFFVFFSLGVNPKCLLII